jgi:hypothetical protein
MKTIRYIFSLCLMALTVWTCADEEKNVDFANTATAPANLAIQFDVTQDNTGLVTMLPTAEGAVSFEITFGDDTPDPVSIENGENLSHNYGEGSYTVSVTAYGVTGLTSNLTQELVISFEPPTNLEVFIENDPAVSKLVNVTVNADFAVNFEVYSGESGVIDPVVANIGETANIQYSEAGIYDITVIVLGAAIETTTYVEEGFEVTEILAPTQAAPTPSPRESEDVVSIFSDAYNNVTLDELPTAWSSSGFAEMMVESNNIWQLSNIDFIGMVTNYAEGIDLSQMEIMHIDYWVPDGVTNELMVKIVNTVDGGEDIESLGNTISGSWQSIELDMSGFDGGNLENKEKITQILIDSDGVASLVYIDNFYFYKSPSGPSPIVGTWQVASEAGSLGVGPTQGATNWWSIDATGVADRACYFDDSYVFGSDGSFTNVLGSDTWLEGWQAGFEGCGEPVAPHNGTNPATYSYDQSSGTLTIVGEGAYIGLPKAHNGGEDGNPANNTITYIVDFVDDNTIIMDIEAGSGVWWRYKLVKSSEPASPIVGTWQVASEAGSLGVGPTQGATNWWSIDATGVADRACYFDDSYVFGSDGSFTNVLGSDTWLEGWQAGFEGCGEPVAPHNGTNPATYSYDQSSGTLTIVGEGAYIGLPKAHNGGEDGNPANNTITYIVDFVDDNTIIMDIEAGSGVWWRYKLVKN